MKEQFSFYGYSSPNSGKYYVDETEYSMGEDFRTVKRYKEYKDVGFDILLLQHENSYTGEDWESSNCNLCMTRGYQAGLKKIIVSDQRLKDLCEEENLVGENGKFRTEQDLVEYLDYCTKPYREKEGFYGLQLLDEPHRKTFTSYGLVVRNLKKVVPNAYFQNNLYTIVELKTLSPTQTDQFLAYDEYLNTFLDEVQTPYLCFDDYPFRVRYIIGGNTLRANQMVAEVCKKRGIEMQSVVQSHCWLTKGRMVVRRVTEPDMRWQMNMMMGLGVREFGFFTYFTRHAVRLEGGISTCGVDGTALINRDGSRTKLYYVAKKIIKEMQAFAPVILSHEYDNNYLFFGEGQSAQDFEWTAKAIVNTDCPIGVKPDKGITFVTKMNGQDGKSVLYMVENLGNIKDEFDGAKPQRVKIDLGCLDGVEVNVYRRGKKIEKKMVNGKFTQVLRVGDAIFIELKR